MPVESLNGDVHYTYRDNVHQVNVLYGSSFINHFHFRMMYVIYMIVRFQVRMTMKPSNKI